MNIKKFLLIIIFIFCTLPAFCANWIEIFEKKYIDFSSIQINKNAKIIKFWVKALRLNPQKKIMNKDYWYSLERFEIDCKTRQSRVISVNVYDLKDELIYSDNYIPQWNEIVPDTYADGYYRLFCSVNFEENPLLEYAKYGY